MYLIRVIAFTMSLVVIYESEAKGIFDNKSDNVTAQRFYASFPQSRLAEKGCNYKLAVVNFTNIELKKRNRIASLILTYNDKHKDKFTCEGSFSIQKSDDPEYLTGGIRTSIVIGIGYKVQYDSESFSFQFPKEPTIIDVKNMFYLIENGFKNQIIFDKQPIQIQRRRN
jgi:hypothetical protein